MRRLALCAALVVASGCTKNHAELKAIQATLDRQLAEQQERADNLNELRKDVEVLELKVAEGATVAPEVKAELSEPAPIAPFTPVFPPLPPESVFEGSTGAQLRVRIGDTEARIMQLSKVIGEAKRLEARKERLTRALARIEELRAKP